jgi:hypothetical protein
LRCYAFETVEDLAKHLAKAHRDMMAGELGCIGYLYKQQTLRVRELTSELQNAKRRE